MHRRRFPRAQLEAVGYGAVWRGQGAHHGVAILARGVQPVLTRRELPGDPDDREARYIEAAVNGVLVGCLYLPNGNPRPGPKFDYKLRWFERLNAYAAQLITADVPALMIGDYNVVPTDGDTTGVATNAFDWGKITTLHRRRAALDGCHKNYSEPHRI